MRSDASKLRIKLTVAAAEHPELHAALADVIDPRQRVGRLKILATKGLIFERSRFTAVKRRRRESANGNPPPALSDPQRDPGTVEAGERFDLSSGGAEQISRVGDSPRLADSEPSVLAMLDWEGDGDAT